MKKKSLSINAFFNSFRVVLNLIFPLITFPYIFRTLGVDYYGKYQFSNSIVSYFILLAALGISSYAIREGSKYRNDEKKMSKFVSDIFSINLISCCFSLLLLFFLIFFVSKFNDYRLIISVLSINVITNTIGMEWLLNIYEQFQYITIRTFIFQIVSIVLLFLFVHSPSDLIIYAAVVVISNGGANVLNFLRLKKILNITFTFQNSWKKHFPSIFILFLSTLSQQIYINSDITLLGILNSDREVGLYSSATKIYNISKQLINAIITVSIPRFSYLIGRNDVKKYSVLANKMLNVILVLALPLCLGLCLISKDVVLIIAGSNYVRSSIPLSILSFSLLFGCLAYLFSNAVLINFKCEKIVLVSSIISSSLNIILNLILLPKFNIIAAASTTLLSEFLMFVICFKFARKKIRFSLDVKNLIVSILGCFLILFCCFVIHYYVNSLFLRTFLSVFLSVVMYFGIHVIFRSYFFTNYMYPKFKLCLNAIHKF